MRPPYHVPLWKTAPIIRLLLPLIAGIMLQWYLKFSLLFILLSGTSFLIGFVLLSFVQASAAFYVRNFRGLLLHFFIAALGAWLTWQKDIRHHKDWYGHYMGDSVMLVVRINEPLIEKPKSFKAEAMVNYVITARDTRRTAGKILLYFSKDSLVSGVHYGQIIIVNKTPQAIKRTGNPAAFDYKQYAAFQQLHHQLFLKSGDWKPSGQEMPGAFRSWLFASRAMVLGILQTYINDKDHQLGIAEALLIGYKEDLDKALVQAYSNTGVVHIIAISGLHLGLIFFVLTWIFNRVPGLNKSRHIKVILLLSCLWVFALLTGGSASVLRSAVMFTVIVIGKYYFRQSSIYSSLSASAFLLLCYNPYYLWDVGFQLSYLAVIGIVALQQRLYRVLYVKNRMLRSLWNMASITVAAQVATFPVCLYYFHQFPNFFLFTNMITVPLSTVILFTEVLLIVLSPVKLLAVTVGWATGYMIMAMNNIILFFDNLPYGMIKQIYADIPSTAFLYAVLFCFCSWLLRRTKTFLKACVLFLTGFSVVHAHATYSARQQQKVIIYNVARYRAVDFIAGNSYAFVGDSLLDNDETMKNFHLRSSRIYFQARHGTDMLAGLEHRGCYWQFCGRKLIFLDSSNVLRAAEKPLPIDVLLLSHNTSMEMTAVAQAVSPAVVVFDASSASWQIEKWKKDCETLNLRFHSVSEQGAFILDVREPEAFGHRQLP